MPSDGLRDDARGQCHPGDQDLDDEDHRLVQRAVGRAPTRRLAGHDRPVPGHHGADAHRAGLERGRQQSAVSADRGTDESRATQKDFASGVCARPPTPRRGARRSNRRRARRSPRPRRRRSTRSSPTPDDIVGGTVAPAGAYPFFVSVKTTGGFAFCGGTLVSSIWVLTAAHCVDGGTTPASLKLVIGAWQLNNEAPGDIRVGHRDPPPPELEPVDLRQRRRAASSQHRLDQGMGTHGRSSGRPGQRGQHGAGDRPRSHDPGRGRPPTTSGRSTCRSSPTPRCRTRRSTAAASTAP